MQENPTTEMQDAKRREFQEQVEIANLIRVNNEVRVAKQKTDADILVCAASRNKPSDLIKSIANLVFTCNNRDNFDILFVIDDDQLEMYQQAINVCKPDFICLTKHLENDWSNMQVVEDLIFNGGNYYFFMPFGDDIRGLSPGWDKEIISKKHYYEDDIFLLYNLSNIWGREKQYHENCYYVNGECLVHSHGETMPIWTKKLFNFVKPIFHNANRYKGYKEVVYLTIIHLLYKWYGKNRNVEGHFHFNYNVNDGISIKIYEQVWEPFLINGFEELRPIVENIKNYIDGFVESIRTNG